MEEVISLDRYLERTLIITSLLFIGFTMALQEGYSFVDGNNTVLSFLDLAIVCKCECGFYSVL
jgi:hypothetical protein